MQRFLSTVILLVFAGFCHLGQVHAAATLLPPGENCFQATTGINGMVGTIGPITGGAGGAAGSYGGVTLTGGSGSGATANVTVAGGAVTAVTILNPGTQYVVGDVLSAASGTIGGVTGFSIPVASVAINGSLAGGTVTFYIPNTQTFKQTWQNATQTIANTNPVTLDANGCAIIYGTGSYRQIVKDSLGNTVWDQITTDTSANNNTFWAGLSGGTPNAITVTDPGFNATDGSVIQFIALNTNTTATTLNPSSFGNVSIVKDTTAGPVPLTGGEITQGNSISVVYYATTNTFHLLNPPIASASGASSPLCGFSNLVLTNDTSTPNTKITLTADQVVTQSNAGLVINRSNINLSGTTAINLTINGAGGLDGANTLAVNTWYNIWALDNGSSVVGLASPASEGNSITFPSGYSYKCRAGAMRTDATGSGTLYRTVQKGKRAQYAVQSSGNTNALRSMISNIQGTNCTTGVTIWNSTSATPYVPPTAQSIIIALFNTYNGGAGATVMVAPNSNYSNANSSNPAPIGNVGSSNQVILYGEITFESPAQTFSFCSSASGGAALAFGWTDSVNAF